MASAGDCRTDRLAGQLDRAGADRYLAEDGPADAVVAGAAQAYQAQDLAGAHRTDRPDPVRHQPLDGEDHLRRASGGCMKTSSSDRPTMLRTRVGWRGLGHRLGQRRAGRRAAR